MFAHVRFDPRDDPLPASSWCFNRRPSDDACTHNRAYCRCMRGAAAAGAYGIGRMYRARTCLPARDARAVPCCATQCHAMQCNAMFIERTEFHMQIQHTTHLYIIISPTGPANLGIPLVFFCFSVGRESDHALSPSCLFFLFPAAADDTTRTGADGCGWTRSDTAPYERFVGLETPGWTSFLLPRPVQISLPLFLSLFSPLSL